MKDNKDKTISRKKDNSDQGEKPLFSSYVSLNTNMFSLLTSALYYLIEETHCLRHVGRHKKHCVEIWCLITPVNTSTFE
jgi:hypothetical protein